jgi:hypothetical protein
MRGPCHAFMLAAAVLLLVPTSMTLAQSPSLMNDQFVDREVCIRECRYLLDPVRPGFRHPRAMDPQQAYALCIRNCDKQFWKDVERDPDE